MAAPPLEAFSLSSIKINDLIVCQVAEAPQQLPGETTETILWPALLNPGS